jgi:haloacetate dehalogenase
VGLTIDGFRYQRVAVGDVCLNVARGGSGSPIVLLHGFPETHLAWREVATDLAVDHEVICPDLRGYGDSDRPADDLAGLTYAKRTMAADIVGLARALGHDRFALAGHDRGGLVAFRAGLDYPDTVTHLAVLDVIPPAQMFAALRGTAGIFAFHLYLLASPPPLPEGLIGAAPDLFFGHFLDAWADRPGAIPDDVRAIYLANAATPEAICAVCADYRASAGIDSAHDEADRRAGARLRMPVTALWQDPGDLELPFDPAEIWAGWAPDLRTAALDCGHFLPEERPTQVAEALRDLLNRST